MPMNNAVTPGSTNATYSPAYFTLRGKYQEQCLKGMADDVEGITAAVNDALHHGIISDREHADLLAIIARRGADEHTDEYNRLRRVIDALNRKGGGLLPEQRTEVQEEVELAKNHGLLTEDEAEELLRITADTSSKIIDIRDSLAQNDARRCPQRQRAAKKRAQHSEGYAELLEAYKGLYTSETRGNIDGQTRKFFRLAADLYRQGRITVQEYREVHRALDDKTAFLDNIRIDPRCQEFTMFRERVLDILSTDAQVQEVILQICAWAMKRGVQAAAIMADVYGIANKYLEPFFESGVSIYTVARREQMQQMPLLQMNFQNA